MPRICGNRSETQTPHRQTVMNVQDFSHFFGSLLSFLLPHTRHLLCNSSNVSGLDEIRPQGRGLAQLATLNTADETRRGQLHGSVAPRRATTHHTASCTTLALSYFFFSLLFSCLRTACTDAQSSFNRRIAAK